MSAFWHLGDCLFRVVGDSWEQVLLRQGKTAAA